MTVNLPAPSSVIQAALEQVITVQACIAWYSSVCLAMLQVGRALLLVLQLSYSAV